MKARPSSFRASSGLAGRLAAAEHAYAELTHDPWVAARITRQLELSVARHLRKAPGAPLSGGVPRALTEAFVEAVEHAVDEPGLIAEMQAFDTEDVDGLPWRDAAARQSFLAGGN